MALLFLFFGCQNPPCSVPLPNYGQSRPSNKRVNKDYEYNTIITMNLR